jgi:hypothetical protein
MDCSYQLFLKKSANTLFYYAKPSPTFFWYIGPKRNTISYNFNKIETILKAVKAIYRQNFVEHRFFISKNDIRVEE